MSRFTRAFDLVGAAAGLAVFAPVMLVVTAAILLDDGPPVFFRQPRLGHGRRPFSILKFRSMRGERVTRVGRVLRATGLDEVAQFLNILRGEMSAVGPRPLTSADAERLGWTGSETDFRWSAKPGLTGLAQLAGARSAEEALALDRLYLTAWSPRIDCTLVALSFVVNACGKERVRRWLRRSGFVQTLTGRDPCRHPRWWS